MSVNLYAQEDVDALLNRIDDLERQMNDLTEQAEARKRLEITEKERVEKEKEVLEAVDRDYTLMERGSFGLDYSLSYSYSPTELFIDDQAGYRKQSDHTVTHMIAMSYAILNNLTVDSDIPIMYRYNKIGTEDELDETDIGDITVGVVYQPFKAPQGEMTSNFSLNVILPTGKSPFDIALENELSTGSGSYSVSAGVNFSKPVDPVVFFGSMSIGYRFPVTGLNQINSQRILNEVTPGENISFGLGLAYSLSYEVYMNMQFSGSYTLENEYVFDDGAFEYESPTDTNASFVMGLGWKASQKTTVTMSTSWNLTEPGFSLTCRVPFTFVM